MRLLTLLTDSGPRAAVQRDGSAVLLPAADGDAPYEDVGALLRAGSPGLEAARSALDEGTEEVTLRASTILRPVLNPGATVCVGLTTGRTSRRWASTFRPTRPCSPSSRDR
jgi:acylpyruvate hydrolase